MPIVLPPPKPPVPKPVPAPLPAVERARANPVATAPAASAMPDRVRFQGANSPRTFWGDNCNFNEIATHELANLWALCAAGMSYSDSNVTYNAFKDLVGAQSVSVAVTGTATVPRAIWVDYQDYRVLVVRGTSRQEQFDLYKTSRVRPYLITPTWITPAASESAYMAAGPNAFMWLFEAFAQQAQPIHDAIVAAYSGGETRPLYCVGHSLGGVILDLVWLRIGKELFNSRWVTEVGWSGFTRNEAYATFARRFADSNLFGGGYLFGAPLTGYANTAALQYIRGGNEPTPSTEWGGTYASFKTLRPWFNRLACRLRHFYHGGDPIPWIPYTFRNSPWFVWAATAGGASADHELQNGSTPVTYGLTLKDEELEAFKWKPNSPSEFTERATKYHMIDPMIDMTADAMVGKHGALPTHWAALVNWAKALPDDGFTPTF